MGKILLIEDNGVLADDISKKLKNHDIEIAYSYLTATAAWEEKNGDYDCIILDLEIETDGIDLEKLNKYHRVQGILLLDEFGKQLLNQDKAPDKKVLWEKTVVYSAFIDELKDKEIMKNAPGNFTPIHKRWDNSLSKLVKAVEEVIRKKK